MASIRKRGNSYLLIVSMGYDADGKRRKPQQKTVHPPQGMSKRQTERWLQEQAALYEASCRGEAPAVDRKITLAAYTELWLRDIAPAKLAVSTLHRTRQDAARFLPELGQYRLTELRPQHFRQFYAKLQKVKSKHTGKPLSAHTVEGVHACLCGILSDAMEGGYITHNPAWRTYKYSGKKTEKLVADEATAAQIIAALEQESIKYELYFKLLIATGIRRGECCALQWQDIDYDSRAIHIRRNAVKVTGQEIIVKEPKTSAGDRRVYFSAEMESLLREYQQECRWETENHDLRSLQPDDFLFRRKGTSLPMTPTTFTWRFKLILKKHGLPQDLNVHSLRHTNASLLIATGADVTTVAGLLGHAQPSTTLDIYSHAFDKNKREASRIMQSGLDI